jgi:hypothetical protein
MTGHTKGGLRLVALETRTNEKIFWSFTSVHANDDLIQNTTTAKLSQTYIRFVVLKFNKMVSVCFCRMNNSYPNFCLVNDTGTFNKV